VVADGAGKPFIGESCVCSKDTTLRIQPPRPAMSHRQNGQRDLSNTLPASQLFRASKVAIHLIHVTVLTALHRRITIYAVVKLFSPFSSPMPRGPFSARSDLGYVGVHVKT
jgi:hypothetical protein